MDIRNFTVRELTATEIRIRNFPETFDVYANLLRTAETLQRARDVLGMPIIVNSGYRSEIVNGAVGGAKNSAHMRGLAADVTTGTPKGNAALYNVLRENIKGLAIDQLIAYTENGNRDEKIKYLHIGLCDGEPRMQLIFKKA